MHKINEKTDKSLLRLKSFYIFFKGGSYNFLKVEKKQKLFKRVNNNIIKFEPY